MEVKKHYLVDQKRGGQPVVARLAGRGVRSGSEVGGIK